MEMVDLKSPKKTEKEMKLGAMPTSVEQDQYPWGTRITLGEEQIAKMGDVYDNAEVGGDVDITAKGQVVAKRANAVKGVDGKNKMDRSMEIQMTKMSAKCKTEHDKGTMDDFMKVRQKK
jgi:hypothetical protein